MTTFHYAKTPVVPAHCLWVSALLLESGSRTNPGMPRLYRARHAAGKRPEMGETVPGAWGAPGTDLLSAAADGFSVFWAKGSGSAAVSCQIRSERMAIRSLDSLIAGADWEQAPDAVKGTDSLSPETGVKAGRSTSDHSDKVHESRGPALAEEIIAVVPEAEVGSGTEKVRFFPKPSPWKGAQANGEKNLPARGPISFCRKVVRLAPDLRSV